MKKMKKGILLPAVLLLLALSPSFFTTTQAQGRVPEYWPTTGWRTSPPETQGVNSTMLQEMDDYLVTQDLDLHSLLVIRNGYIVYEDYPNSLYDVNRKHILHSVTKSFTSCLIGIAIEEGFIGSITDTVLSYFPDRTIQNMNAYKEAMTIEHLLTMTSGYDWDEWLYPYTDPRNDLIEMIVSGECTQFMLDHPVVDEPGTVWLYNTGVSYLLAALIYETSGLTPLEFAFQYVFGALGITDVYWTESPEGINYGGSELHLTPRDLAKFGFLFLHNGLWDSQQVVPGEWVSESTEIAVFLGASLSYGYQWWVNSQLQSYEAHGLYAQRLVVIPEYDLIVVFTAEIEGEPPYNYLIREYIIPACGEIPSRGLDPLVLVALAAVLVGVPIIAGVLYLQFRIRPRSK
jgi:CubicO group peptidase (beta-lactamase class C family)